MSDPIDIVERLAGMSADHGPDGWPAVQMREYAGAQARTLAAQVLLRMADEAPISGNELARVRVLLAAASLRAMPIWTDAPADGSNPNPPECDPRA